MHPILFRVFGLTIHSFGVMFALAVVVGAWLTLDGIEHAGKDADKALRVLVWAVVAGVVGARVWWVIEGLIRDTLATDGVGRGLLTGGLTWYGGFALGLAVLLAATWRSGIGLGTMTQALAPGLAVAQGIGRIGCFLAGDDYGKPTDSWIGIAFPQGSPPTDVRVHPTQLYEMAWLFAVGYWLWRRRDSSRSVFAEYLILAGSGRFAVEFLRRNPPFLGPLTSAQTIALASLLAGIALWIVAGARRPEELEARLAHSQAPPE